MTLSRRPWRARCPPGRRFDLTDQTGPVPPTLPSGTESVTATLLISDGTGTMPATRQCLPEWPVRRQRNLDGGRGPGLARGTLAIVFRLFRRW
jgi:hypothetical protein